MFEFFVTLSLKEYIIRILWFVLLTFLVLAVYCLARLIKYIFAKRKKRHTELLWTWENWLIIAPWIVTLWIFCFFSFLFGMILWIVFALLFHWTIGKNREYLVWDYLNTLSMVVLISFCELLADHQPILFLHIFEIYLLTTIIYSLLARLVWLPEERLGIPDTVRTIVLEILLFIVCYGITTIVVYNQYFNAGYTV